MSFFDKLKGGIGLEESPAKLSAKPKKKAKAEPKPKSKIEVKKEEPSVKSTTLAEQSPAEGELAIDVFETDDDIVIQSTIGGVKAEDLDISIENDLVTIRGKREKSVEEKTKKYFFQECYWGSFMRQVILPEEVDGNRAKATVKNGILILTMPKLHRKTKRQIAVKPEE